MPPKKFVSKIQNMTMKNLIETRIKQLFKTKAAFAKSQGENPSNFKRKIFRNIERLNKWIVPLGLEVKIIEKDVL